MRDYVCDQYARLRSARFSAWAIDLDCTAAFPSGRIDAILRAPLTAAATASFTCALHARCIQAAVRRGKATRRDGGGRESLLPFSFCLLFSLSE